MTDTTPTESNLSGLDRKDFQKNINSRKTDLYILKNAQGMEVAVTNYGCAILSIMVPDKNGKFANVILGHDSIEHVINSPEPFLSTTHRPLWKPNCQWEIHFIWRGTPIDCQQRSQFTARRTNRFPCPRMGCGSAQCNRPSFSIIRLPTVKRASPVL